MEDYIFDCHLSRLCICAVTADMLSAVNESQGYALGRGNDGSIYKYDAFGGVWVSDGNGGTVQIGDDGGYYNPE